MAVKRENMITVKSSDIKPVTGRVIKKSKKRKPLSFKKSDKTKAIKKADKTFKNKPLTEKQKAFCKEYVYDWNATRSYKAIYQDVKNDNTAHAAACRLLRNVTIQQYITEIQKDLEKLSGISRLKVISEHSKLAFSSIAHLHNTWIERKDFEKLTEDQKACISEISTQTRTLTINEESVEVEFVKIKLYDKQKALDSISKMLGYDAPSKVELTGKNGNPLGISLTKEETKKISEQLEHDC